MNQAAIPAPAGDGATEARVSALAMAGVIGVWSLPLLIMLLIVPKFEEIFKDFGVALPDLTIWIINTSRWLVGDQAGQTIPGIVFAGPIFLIVLGAVTAAALRTRSWLGLTALCLLPLAVVPVFVVAMFIPLVSMIESLQGGGGGGP